MAIDTDGDTASPSSAAPGEASYPARKQLGG
jgi:hypothetical protein